MSEEQITEEEFKDLRIVNLEMQLAQEHRIAVLDRLAKKYSINFEAGDDIVGRKVKRAPKLASVPAEEGA